MNQPITQTVAQPTAVIDVKTITKPTTLLHEALLLYDTTNSADAVEFIRVNRRVFGFEGKLLTGMVVFLPAGGTRNDETEMVAALRSLNQQIVREFNQEARHTLAHHANTLDHMVSDPDLARRIKLPGSPSSTIIPLINTMATGVIAGVSTQQKIIQTLLKDLEYRYKFTLKSQGKLTPDFYRYRTQIYQQLDTAGGRVAQTLSGLTPYKQNAKARLKISTKSLSLHWKRNGYESGIDGFKPHYLAMAKMAKLAKHAGVIGLTIDGGLTLRHVNGICSNANTSALDCKKAGIIEGAGFVGGWVGAGAGSAIGYAACNMLFGLPSAGSSLIWCGLALGGAGSIIGGAAIKEAAQSRARLHTSKLR